MRKRNALAGLLMAVCITTLTGCIGPSEGGNRTRKGNEALAGGNYQEALTEYQAAALGGEDEVPAYRGAGVALTGLGRYEDAARAFETALSFADEKMPETVADIRQYLAAAKYRSGDYSGAISVCQEVPAQEKTTAICYYEGASFLAQGDKDQARTAFDEAVALAPQDYLLSLQIYERYDEQNLTTIGDEYLQKALGIAPSDDEDYCRIGQIYYYLEQYDEARNVLASPVEREYLPALELLGRVYLAQEDYTHAQSIYQQLLDKNPESTAAYNGMALCSIESGDYDTALGYIAQGLALEDTQERRELLFNEIVVYEKKLDFTTAMSKAEEYIAAYPTDEAGQKEYKFLSTR